MRGAPYLSTLVAEIHVTVTADRGIARPLVTGQSQKSVILVELSREIVDLLPEGIVDLEIIGLVAGCVEKGEVARKLEILARGIDADRLAALPVHVAPESG